LVRPADREADFAAGWTEEALYYAVLNCALFNFMNRVVNGKGVVTSAAVQAHQRQRHDRAPDDPVNLQAYKDYGRELGLLDPDPQHLSWPRLTIASGWRSTPARRK
jgi:hypothetical protein